MNQLERIEVVYGKDFGIKTQEELEEKLKGEELRKFLIG